MSALRPHRRAATAAARLRPMLPSDLEAVIALEHELFPEDAWSPEMFADEVSQPAETRLYLVAERGPVGRGADAETGAAGLEILRPGGGLACQAAGLAGYAGMMFVPQVLRPSGRSIRGGGSADVLTIAVAGDCWGQGIGSALLEALVGEARRRGCAEVFLEVREDNPRARGLYLRRGFTEIGVRRGYYQPANVDAIVMRKDLGERAQGRGGAWTEWSEGRHRP
jgi:ribosomal-protein-alanine N-acetyltransferase